MTTKSITFLSSKLKFAFMTLIFATALMFSASAWAGRSPTCNLENYQAYPGSIWIQGWCQDPDAPNMPVSVDVWVYDNNNNPVYAPFTILANKRRFGEDNQYHDNGFDHYIPITTPGRYKVVIWVNDVTGDPDISWNATYNSNYYLIFNVTAPYTVTYNTNGGIGGPASQQKCHGVDLTLSTVTPTAEGYDFQRWNTGQYGGGTNYQPGATYSGNGNVTLYAMWWSSSISGSGTEADPYVISSASQWNYFANQVNSGNTYNGKFIKMGADFTVSDMAGTNGSPFMGTFDGCGHTMTLDINATGTGGGHPNIAAAPFRYVNQATFKNINLTGTVKRLDYPNDANICLGGLIGVIWDWASATIISCRSSVTLNYSFNWDSPNFTTGYMGGFVGWNKGTVTFTDCLFDGTLSGNRPKYACGFIGWHQMYGGDANGTAFYNCLSNGTYNTTSSWTSKQNFYFFQYGDRNIYHNCYRTTDVGFRQATLTSATGETLRSMLGNGWIVNGSGQVVPGMTLTLNCAANNTTTINRANGITYDRVVLSNYTLYHDGSWNTICLPFNLTSFDGTPLQGATVKRLDNSRYNGESMAITFADVTSIEAGKPYIVKFTSGSNVDNPAFTNVTIRNTAVSSISTPYATMIGSYAHNTNNNWKYDSHNTNRRAFHAAFSAITTPSRNGYIFGGWYTNAGLTTAFTTIPFAANGTVTLYAKWTCDNYTITYNLNGGNVAIPNPTSYTVESSDITLVNPTRDHYTFTGWTGTDLTEPTMTVTIPRGSTGNRTYTANWTYNALTLANNADNSDAISAVNGLLYDVTLGGYTLHRDGSWNTICLPFDLASFTNTPLEGATVKTITSSTYSDGVLTINATDANSIEAGKPYIVKWSSGSDITNPVFNNVTINDATIVVTTDFIDFIGSYAPFTNESYLLDANNPNGYAMHAAINISDSTGCTLTACYTDAAHTNTVSTIPFDATTGNVTLYPQWDTNHYSITYHLGSGGTVEPANPTSFTYFDPNDITLNNPTRRGYTFLGWTGSNGTTPQTTVTIPAGSTGDREYTANWSPTSYTITYNLNGGTADNPASYIIETATFTLANPTRTGYTFTGWTGTDLAEASMEVTIANNSIGDRVFTANWTPTIYTISYEPNGGILNDENPTTYNIESDYITLANPTRDGYYFVGWTGSNGNTPQTTVTIPTGSISNRTYTANWTELYTISYDNLGDDGTFPTPHPTNYTVLSDNITLVNPVRELYDFAGWTGSNGESPQMTVTIPHGSTGNLSYTATWSRKVGIYVSYNTETYEYETHAVDNPTPVSSYSSTLGSDNNVTWYIVTNNVTISDRVFVYGTVNLILADGASLTTSKGIIVETGKTLNIYGQENGTGALHTYSYNGPYVGWQNAAIGCQSESGHGLGAISIHGGNIEAYGDIYSMAIGSSLNSGGGESINIYGGTTHAEGGEFAFGAAIGYGTPNKYVANGMCVRINNNTTPENAQVPCWNLESHIVDVEPCPGHVFSNGQCLYCGAYCSHQIIYNGNGSNEGEVPAATTCNVTTGILFATGTVGNAGTLARTGYTFTGWNTAADGSGTAFDPGSTITLRSDTTLYAQWNLVTYTITYNLDGGTESLIPNPTSYNIVSDEISLNAPTKISYDADNNPIYYYFRGWTGTGLDHATMEVSIPQGSTGDRSFTATWEVNPSPYPGVDVDTAFQPGEVGYFYVRMAQQEHWEYSEDGDEYLVHDEDNPKVVNIPEEFSSGFKVYDDGGKDGEYWYYQYGNTLTLICPENYAFYVQGSMNTESDGCLTIFDGEDDQCAKLLDSANGVRNIGPLFSSGNSITFFFSFDDNHFLKEGFDLTVSLVPPPPAISFANDDSQLETKNTSVIAANNGERVQVTFDGSTLYKDETWNTLCLPFDILDISSSPLRGTVVRQPASIELSESGALTMSFTDANKIEAGKPYIVSWKNVKPQYTVLNNDETRLFDGEVGMWEKEWQFASEFVPVWEFEISGTMAVTGYTLTTASDIVDDWHWNVYYHPEYNPRAWTLEASTDRVTWTTIDSRDATVNSEDALPVASNEDKSYSVTQQGSYRYFRFSIIGYDEATDYYELGEFTLQGTFTPDNIENPTFNNATIKNELNPMTSGLFSFGGNYSTLASTDGLLLDAHNTGANAFHATLSLLERPWYTDAERTVLATTIPFDPVTGNVTLYTTADGLMLTLANDDSNEPASNNDLITAQDGEFSIVTLADRTLYRHGTWNTLCLPFDIQSIVGTPLWGSKVKTLSSLTYDDENSSLSLNFGDDLTSIEAGKPYIVKWDELTLPIVSVPDYLISMLDFITELPEVDNGQYTQWDEGNDNYEKLVDGDLSTRYGTEYPWYGSENYDPYVEFHYANAITPTGYALWTANDEEGSRNPSSWTIKARNDENEDWTTLVTVDNSIGDMLPMANNACALFDLNNSTSYRYFRFEATYSSNNDFQLAELQFFTGNAIVNANVENPVFSGVIVESASNPVTAGDFTFAGNYSSLSSTEGLLIDAHNDGGKALHATLGSNRDGYNVSGWYTDAELTTPATSIPFDATTGNATLYLQWTANTYTVDFNANGGNGSMDPQVFIYDAGATALTANSFTREDYIFNGWNTLSDGSGTSYADGQPVQNLTAVNGETITLYAQWKHAVTFTANSDNKVYDGTVMTNSGYTTSGLLDGDIINATITVTGSQTDVGTSDNIIAVENVVIMRGEVDVTSDYAIVTTNGILTVIPKAVTVTADDLSKTYGDVEPLLTSTVQGLLGDDVVTYSITRVAGSNIGNYAITPTGDAIQGNYSVVYVPGTLTINPAPVTVTADIKTKTYSDTDPLLTATIEGLMIGEPESLISYSLERASGENTGVYTITASGDATQGNYTVTFVTGTLTIEPASVTVTAEAKSKNYGDNDPTLTATVSALVNGDPASSISYTLSRDAGEDAGGYTILPTGEAIQGNYAVTFIPSFMTINPMTVTITITGHNSTIDYDGEEHSVTGYDVASDYPGVLTTDVIVERGDTATRTNVGTTSMGLTADLFHNTNGNYDATFSVIDGYLTITPKVVNNPTIILSQTEYDYDGSAHTPTVIVKDEETVIPEAEYSVSYSNNIEVGTATVTITDNVEGNYTVSGSANFFINTTVATSIIAAGGWQAISSPTHNNGNNETVAGVTNLTTATYDLFRYDEATATWENYKTLGFDLERGRGYIYRRAEACTLSFNGQPNSGDFTVSLSTTEAAGDLKGFNLIGNPYPHPYTLDRAHYSLNPDGSWLAHTAGSSLAVGQGALVQSSSPADLSFSESGNEPAKSYSNSICFKVEGNNYYDLAYAIINSELSVSSYENENAELIKVGHLNEEAPMLSIQKENEKYAIAIFDNDELQKVNYEFPMVFNGQSGSYTLTAYGISGYCHLVDLVTGRDIDLTRQPSYSFNNTQFNGARFLIRLSPEAAEASQVPFAHWNGNAWVVNGTGTLHVFDVLGRVIANFELGGSTFEIQNSTFPAAGVYMLKLRERTQKIVVK